MGRPRLVHFYAMRSLISVVQDCLSALITICSTPNATETKQETEGIDWQELSLPHFAGER